MLRDQGLPIVLQGPDALPPAADTGVHVEEMSWHVPIAEPQDPRLMLCNHVLQRS
jgi:hypothetical protein